jgi:hypothetical protein
LAVTIDQNNPPEALVSLSGSSSGEIGTSYKYTTSTKDPDCDKLRYTFDWGDGTTFVTCLVNSGKSASATHIWSKAGAYQVKAMATDSIGAPTQWSPSLAVTINNPPNKTSTSSEYDLSMANTLNLQASAAIRANAFKKYLYAFPASNPLNITGLSGSVSLKNTAGNLAQALITVWFNPDSCPESGAMFRTSGREAFAYVQPITSYTYLWQLTGDVSAGAFTGSPYSNPPVGPWIADFDFYVYPDCAGMKIGPQGPDDYYSKIPANATKLAKAQLSGNGTVIKHAEVQLNGNDNATKLAELQLNGSGKVALQQPTVRQFSPMLLKPGNCLVCLAKFTAPSGGATLESQIQVLLQNIKGTNTGRVQEPVLEEANEQYRKLLKEKDQYLTCDHCQARLN